MGPPVARRHAALMVRRTNRSGRDACQDSGRIPGGRRCSDLDRWSRWGGSGAGRNGSARGHRPREEARRRRGRSLQFQPFRHGHVLHAYGSARWLRSILVDQCQSRYGALGRTQKGDRHQSVVARSPGRKIRANGSRRCEHSRGAREGLSRQAEGVCRFLWGGPSMPPASRRPILRKPSTVPFCRWPSTRDTRSRC